MTLDTHSVLLLLLVGLMAGVLSGSVGIGGGIVMVPALVWLLGYSQHQAQGTSLAVLMLPVVFLAVRNYYKAGTIDPQVVLVIAAAFVLGSYLGSKWSLSMPVETVRKIFGGVTLLVGLKLILGK